MLTSKDEQDKFKRKQTSWRRTLVARYILAATPAAAWIIVNLLVNGHASIRYFEVTSQILPIFLLALAIEQRYFLQDPQLPSPPGEPQYQQYQPSRSGWLMFQTYSLVMYIYPMLVLLIFAIGEVDALRAVASRDPSTHDLRNTAASLVSMFTALVISTAGTLNSRRLRSPSQNRQQHDSAQGS
jgi:hypothetical protein